METVHVFVAAGAFRTERELREYVAATHTDDGDAISSAFMREVQLSNHEPGCIEAIWSAHPREVRELLHAASYSEQWLRHLGAAPSPADSALCVFSPNVVAAPADCLRMTYLGAFTYEPPGWLTAES